MLSKSLLVGAAIMLVIRDGVFDDFKESLGGFRDRSHIILEGMARRLTHRRSGRRLQR